LEGLVARSLVADIERMCVALLVVAGACAAGPPLLNDWYTSDLPYSDLITGRRYPSQGKVVEVGALRRRQPPVLTGLGLPCTLKWKALADAQGQLLSFLEDEVPVRLDVTGQHGQEVVFDGLVRDCLVESLRPLDPERNWWHSTLQRIRVDVRGLFPFAGNCWAEGEHRDGVGKKARFRQAFDATRCLLRDNLNPIHT
jgi:hypothetical protein